MKKIKILLISMGLIVLGVSTVTGQDTADYFLGHGFAGTGDTVFTNSGTFWDDGYTSNYDQDADWDVYFCTTDGNPNPLTLEFTGFKTHYGGETLPGPYADWDYIKARYDPSVHYNVYNDDTPEFSLTSQNGCIRITMITNGDALTHEGWQAEIYAIPPPTNNDPCGAEYLQAGNVCTPQVFSNKGAFSTGSYPGPCHPYFGGDVWFTAVVPSSGTLKIESFTGTLEWAVMDLFRGSSCAGLTRFACIEDSIGMPTAILESSSIPGLSIGDTVYIRMYGDQAKSGTFGMCASDPTAEIEGHTGPGGVGDDSTNVIWLRADLGTLNSSDAAASNGEGIKTWEDQSGNQNHVVQAAGGQQPLLSNNGINSMPSITYDGSDDYMMAELSTLSAPLTLFTVSKFTDAGADDYLISMGDEISDDKTVSISRDADSLYYAYTNNSEWYGPTLNTHTPYLLHAVHNIASTYHELYINETAQSPADYSTSVVTDGSLRLGSSRNTTNFFGGDIAEFIIYKQILNSAQKIIVENFLAAKYGLSITTDRFSHKPGHKYDVSGIGQVNPSNQHTEAQSAKTLAIGNPTNLDDGEFLMFGHDNGDITSWTSTERPNNDPNVKRIEREWRVDITGDPGSLTITLSDSILPDLLPGFNNYALWTDADGNFSSGAQAIPLVKVDNDYVANSVNLIDNVYITIGTIMPQVSFTQDSSEALESVEFPNIEVSLNYAVNEEISVVFRAIDGTATGGGVDYLLNPGSAVFPAGIKTVNIQPQIVDDTIVEIPDEDFYIRLSDPDPGLILSADSIHTYTILNNDINVSVSTSTDTISDCGTASANISTTVEGTGPYNFVWTPAGGLSDDEIANPVASPAADTWYKVTVTDQTNAAVGMDSIHITVIAKPIKPDITTVGITTFCEGDSVQLSSSAGFSWQWSNGETTRVIYAKTTGSYTVNVIDEFGCASEPSDAEPVTVNPKPATPTMLASGDTDICPGDSVDLTSSDGDNYIWSTGESTKTIRIKTAGNYYVQTQTADGCKSDTSLVTPVTIKTPPDAPTVTASGPTDFCLGDSVDLESSTGTSWLWSNGETTQTIRVKAAGSYSAQITDGTGCLSIPSADTDITLYPVPVAPVITSGGSTDICENDSLLLSSSAGTSYLWSTGEISSTIYAKSAGSYTVQVSNSQGCWSPLSSPINITTQPAPIKPIISFTGNTDFCQGDSLVLTSSAADSYLWSNSGTTPAIIVRTADTYSVRVASANGCLSIPSDAVNITVNSLPVKPSISGDNEYCTGDSVQLSGPAASSYIWSTGESTQTIFATSGSFTLKVGDAKGCMSPISDPYSVTENPLPAKPAISGNSSYCTGDSVLLSTTAADAYLWSTGESTRSIYGTAGSYTVVITDANGCGSPISDPHSITENSKPSKPVITAGGPLEFWLGDSVILSSSTGMAYLWSPGAETTKDITVKNSGNFQVSITDANGCVSDASDPVTVVVNSFIKPVITVTGDTEFCEETSQTTLTSSDGFAYMWSTGETTKSIVSSISGSFSVVVFDEAGHQSEPSDPVLITVYQNPATTLTGKTDVACYGESTGTAEVTTSGGTSPYTYLWSDMQTSAEATELPAATHNVITTDANQCTASLDVTINQPDELQVLEVITQPYCSDSYDGSIEIEITGGTSPYSILWSDGSSGTMLQNLGAGTYPVEATDANQCKTTESYTLTPEADFCVIIPEIITPNGDGYNDTWRLPGIEYYPEATIEVYDRWGKQVFYSTGYDQPWDGKYNGKVLPMDSYHYVINLNNGSPTQVGNISILK